jgi:hypothetical protein
MILVNAKRACGGIRPVRESRIRLEEAFRTDAVVLFQIGNCKAAARKREGWRKKAGEDLRENGPQHYRRRRKRRRIFEMFASFMPWCLVIT